MGNHTPTARDYCNGVPEPVNDGGAAFRAVQSAVLNKAGLIEGQPGVFHAVGEPTPVSITITKTGHVLTVHHSVAIQRILQGVATLN
jgi:hypothetical protein